MSDGRFPPQDSDLFNQLSSFQLKLQRGSAAGFHADVAMLAAMSINVLV